MESFGLFNFLKSAFSPPPADAPAERTEEKPTQTDAPALSPFLDKLFPPATDGARAEETQQKQPPTAAAPPSSTDSETAAPENNPFLALMERHDRMSKNIGRNAPKK